MKSKKLLERKFNTKVAIVTGGASGIGRALGERLAALGATVILADVNGEGCELAAASIRDKGGGATAATADVTDADAMKALVASTVRSHGQIDYMFNNAGVIAIGEARVLELSDWNRVLDVNLRGVVHGVVAAYPVMIEQGFGHIVNTGSLAGLIPGPTIVPYTTSKHAVVGLSTSLRPEAAQYGVQVSVVCPGLIRMMDTANFVETDQKMVESQLPFKWYSAEACARDIVEGVARNQAVIIVARHAKVMAGVFRLFPRLSHHLVSWGFQRQHS